MAEWTVRSIAEAVSRGQRTAAAVIDEALGRIERANPALNALIELDPARVRADARAVDDRVAAGEILPLAGVPVAVKDNIWVAGRRVTQGSRLFAEFRAPLDAIAVERLRRAGAVVVGMANTPEFAAKGNTSNRLFGPTRHPLEPSLTPGGSSGGPAVAVAAGMVPLAIGTDAGGSGRRPPAHVGVVGFKPSFGAIPYGPGFAEPFIGLSSIAPIAPCVADVALAFEVMVGPDVRDPDSVPIEDEPPPAPLTIAYSPRLGLDVPVDHDVAAAMERALEALEAAGIAIARRDPVWPAAATETALMPLQQAGLAALHGERFRREPELFDPDIGAQIERGLGLIGIEVAQALALGAEVARSLAAFLAEVDLLLGPTTPCVAWPLERLGPETIGGVAVSPRGHAVFTPLFNHAKVPALSLPCGRGRDGLPVGLQIIAGRGRDRLVLAFAERAEAALASVTGGAAVEAG
jgi:aspartyl-tRNA(Asn)/glutamyl-tRNA(Gln) amidotransferase subunit A